MTASSSPCPPAPPSRHREALVLGLSAIVVIAGAVVGRRSAAPAPAPVEHVMAATLPPPLPSGAPRRGMEELPSDDERDTGCHFTDRGFGDYVTWRKLALPDPAPLARVLVPQGRAVAEDGTFRLLVHFHGSEPVRKQLAPEGFDLVIAAIDAGVGSHAYERAMPKGMFEQIISAIEREVALENHLPTAHTRHIALSSWSAGYGAITQILSRTHPPIDALLLLDSLYAGYPPGKRALEHGQLGLFFDAASEALRGGAFFSLTHTAISTPGYASTGEVASFLLRELGIEASRVEPNPDDAYPLSRIFEEGHLSIRGYAGVDRDAHCGQLRLLPPILRNVVLPSWKP